MEEVKKQRMESLFCPYEQALTLKELGFNEPCFGFYNRKEKLYLCDYKNANEEKISIISAPLYQQAFRFFREKYKLSGEIYIFKNIWNFDIEDISNSIQLYTSDIMCYNSYEEAELACIRKLIEIAKEQNVK